MEINNAADLRNAIKELERRKVIQESILKKEFHETRESLKPINMIKSAFKKFTHTPEIRDSAIKTVAGVGFGLLTRNMFIGKAIPVVKQLMNDTVQREVQTGIQTGTQTIKAYGTAIINNLFRKKDK